MQTTTVADVMRREVITMSPSTPVKDVMALLIRHRISAVPVVDSCRNVLGVVTESDLLCRQERDAPDARPPSRWRSRRARQRWRKGSGLTAADVMTAPAITVESTAFLPPVAKLLDEAGIRRAFVVDRGNLVGVVARHDLLRAYLRNDEDIVAEINRDVFDRVLHANPGMVLATVDHGVVMLTGRVEYESDVPLAVRLVGAVRGVVAVHNRLDYCWNGEKERGDVEPSVIG